MPEKENDAEEENIRISKAEYRRMLFDISSLKAEQRIINEAYRFETAKIREMLSQLVTRYEFTPVKLIVYAMVASVLSGFIGSVVLQILKK